MPDANTAPDPSGSSLPASLDGKVALVTGASSGIGAATARALAARGASVAVNFHHGEDRARDVVASIEARGRRAVAVQADVTAGDQVGAMVERAEGSLGPVDVLVLNATGLYGHDIKIAPAADTSLQYIEWLVQRQLRALFHPVHAVLPGMVERRHGSIVAVGAALSRDPAPGFVALSMAKAAVEVAVKTLAREIGPHGVRVNAVGPGLILTESTERMPEAARAANARNAPVQRNGRPEDVAEVIAFLASEQASYLTGAFMPVDGGTTLL